MMQFSFAIEPEHNPVIPRRSLRLRGFGVCQPLISARIASVFGSPWSSSGYHQSSARNGSSIGSPDTFAFAINRKAS